MPPFLAGHVAVVTGAGTGLGAGVARLLSSAGAATVLVSRREAGIQSVAREIASHGGVALPVAADIGDPADIAEIVNQTMTAYGRIDFVINIAGTVEGIGKCAWDLTGAEWRQVCDTNISGPFYLCQAFIPVMVRQQAGRILMLTSSAADMPTRTAAAYGASKAAINQLVRAVAAELDGSGVVVNAFNPGPVATATFDYVEQNLEFGQRRGRWGSYAQSPEKAAMMILWLCSPATTQINGQTIHWRDPATRAALAEMEQALV